MDGHLGVAGLAEAEVEGEVALEAEVAVSAVDVLGLGDPACGHLDAGADGVVIHPLIAQAQGEETILVLALVAQQPQARARAVGDEQVEVPVPVPVDTRRSSSVVVEVQAQCRRSVGMTPPGREQRAVAFVPAPGVLLAQERVRRPPGREVLQALVVGCDR